MVGRNFAIGIIFGTLLAGCAGFTYKYYGLQASSYDGTLLGPKPEDDIPLSVCKPTAQDKSPCVVAMTKEFLAMKQELITLRQDLQACQHSH